MGAGLILLCSMFLCVNCYGTLAVNLKDVRFNCVPFFHNREEFLYFAQICFESFGDRVKYWTTINEPNMFAEMAYVRGVYPPARCTPPFGNCSAGNSDTEPLVAMHNMLLAHAKAAKLYREHFQARVSLLPIHSTSQIV